MRCVELRKDLIANGSVSVEAERNMQVISEILKIFLLGI